MSASLALNPAGDASGRFHVSTFEHALDIHPVDQHLNYHELAALLAPAHPPVRADLVAWGARGESFARRLLAASLRGQLDDALRQTRWGAQLVEAAQRARERGGSDDDVRVASTRRAAAIIDGIWKRVKLRLPCVSPTVYKPGATREAAGVEAITALFLDFDDGTSLDAALAPWLEWPLFAYTTWSHRTDQPRFRVVLVLDEPVPAHAWPRVWRWAWERSGGHIDEKCKDPSRLYMLPAIGRSDAPYQAIRHDTGGWLLRPEWENLPDIQPLGSVGATRTRPQVTTGEAQGLRLARLRLREDRPTRERAAAWLNAKVGDRRADQIRCPSCGRPSVWFWLDPGEKSTATCSHRNSCGWWGHLDVLLDAAGGEDV